MPYNKLTDRPFKSSIYVLAVLIFSIIAALAFASTETVNYTYDNTYQVKKAAYTNFTTSYEYDYAGNITSFATNPEDSTRPSSTITDPTNGLVLTNTPYTITGTATDASGSGIAKVEVSTGGDTWNLANGTTNWNYYWNITSAGPYTIKSKATDRTSNEQTSFTSVNVTAKSTLYANRSSININYTQSRPAAISKVSVTSQPWSVTGSASTTKPWLVASTTDGKTPDGLVVTADPTGLALGNNTGIAAYSGTYATNTLRFPVCVTVSPAGTPAPELQHYNWDNSLSGGDCNVCHGVTRNAFLPSDFNLQDSSSFCISCHNSASNAHGRVDSGTVHAIFVNATTGGGIWPTYGNITAGEYNNQPKARLKNANNVVCNTCHNTMRKQEDYGRVWELTTTKDRLTYYLSDGGWSNYGKLKPLVYRSISIITEPAYSKTRKGYLVSPSEYTYDETAGSITLLTAQDPAAYIYVTLDYPYLRASSEQNRLCSDCHVQTTHKEANCLDCHQAHNSVNIKGIRGTVRTTDLSERTVIFKRYTGVNSFADGNATYDGICEACHTKTKYYRRDGSGFANHSGSRNYDRANCINCHRHKQGFARYTTNGGGFFPEMPGALEGYSM